LNQQFYKNLALWVVILVVMLLLFTTLRQTETAPPNIAYSEFMESVRTSQVEAVTIEEGHITGKYVTSCWPSSRIAASARRRSHGTRAASGGRS
jgi:ATP-dependent Zn protease